MKNKQVYKLCAIRLKSLADPERLRIVELLFDGELNVSQLAEKLDEEIVKVSHHLGVLRHADVVTTEKQGRFVIYRLHPDVVRQGKGELTDRRIDFGCCQFDMQSTD